MKPCEGALNRWLAESFFKEERGNMRFSRSFFHVTIKVTIKEIENGFYVPWESVWRVEKIHRKKKWFLRRITGFSILCRCHELLCNWVILPGLHSNKHPPFRTISHSLRSWRYCVGARLTFWRRSRVAKKGSRDEAVEISLDYITTAPPPNLTRPLHNTASYAGYISHNRVYA